jgi:cytochrome c5
MRRIEILLPVWVAIIVIVMMGVSSWSSPHVIMAIQEAVPTSTSAMPPQSSMSASAGWIILDLPPGASQLEIGAEVYRLVCKACHGDKGQGLTDEWRSTWAPADQNCWQSKCHAANHPPDGFVMPVAPAVVGTTALARFSTASDLHDFISTYMPWQDPGHLTEEQNWQVTAYILKLNNIDPGTELNAKTASQIKLGPGSIQDSKTDGRNTYTYSLLALAVIVLVLLAVWTLQHRQDRHR